MKTFMERSPKMTCKIKTISSRVCERGTKGCEIQHNRNALRANIRKLCENYTQDEYINCILDKSILEILEHLNTYKRK